MNMKEFEEKKEVARREARGRDVVDVGAGVCVVYVGSDVGSAPVAGGPYSKASAGAKSGPCLTYVHHCVFVMCGDLASMWSLFGFCGGPSGKEQCPLCTIARVDQWRGSAGHATPRNRDRYVPIPLSPAARYVMCVLHCTMRVGEFALERLIMNCVNQKEGKNVTIGKASKKKKQSFLFLDPSIVALNKIEVIQRLKNELSAQGKDEESINIWKEKKSLRHWMKPDLVQALDKLLIDKLIVSSKIAEAKCAELDRMEYQALKTMRAEKIPGKTPKSRISKSLLAHDLFCNWYQNDILPQTPQHQEIDKRERGSEIGDEEVNVNEIRGNVRGSGRGTGTDSGRGKGRGTGSGRGKGRGRGRGTEKDREWRGKESGGGRGKGNEAKEKKVEIQGVRKSKRTKKSRKAWEEKDYDDESYNLAVQRSLSGEGSSCKDIGLSGDTESISDILFDQWSSQDFSLSQSSLSVTFSGTDLTSNTCSGGNLSDIEPDISSDLSFAPISFSASSSSLSGSSIISYQSLQEEVSYDDVEPLNTDFGQDSIPFSVANDERLNTPSLQKLGCVFLKLKIPLKFKVVEEEVKLGWYSGTYMQKILKNAALVFDCCPISNQTKKIWTDFYSLLDLLSSDPAKGSSRTQVAALYNEKFQEWKKLFLGVGAGILPEWRIYLHILEMHAGNLYEKFGNLHPWANEAGEHMHALDRMFFFQRSRKGSSKLNTKILTTGLSVRLSHNALGAYRTYGQVPDYIKEVK
jgi:hypothetical protein